jgi:hypothetical protein
MEPMELRDLAHKHGLDVIDFYVLMEFAKEIEELEREACAIVCENIGDYDENIDEYYSDIYAREIRARGE